jgi:hypothetical protein
MLYVLSTFVTVPIRRLDELGRHMGQHRHSGHHEEFAADPDAYGPVDRPSGRRPAVLLGADGRPLCTAFRYMRISAVEQAPPRRL